MSRILGLILREFASDIWVLSMLPLQPSITEKIKERKSKHSNEKRKEKVAQFSGVSTYNSRGAAIRSVELDILKIITATIQKTKENKNLILTFTSKHFTMEKHKTLKP